MVNEECIDLTTTSPEEGSAAKPIQIPESDSPPLKKEEEEEAHDVDKAHVSVPHSTDDFTPEGAAAMRRLIGGSSGGSAGGGGFGMSTIAPSSARASRKRGSSFSLNASPAANYGLFPVPTPTPKKKKKKVEKGDAPTFKTPDKFASHTTPNVPRDFEHFKDVGEHLQNFDLQNNGRPAYYQTWRRRRVLLGAVSRIVSQLNIMGTDSGLTLDNLIGDNWQRFPPAERKDLGKFEAFSTANADNVQVQHWMDHLRRLVNTILPASDDQLPPTNLPPDKLKDCNWKVATLFIMRWKQLKDDGSVVGGYLLDGRDLGVDVVSFEPVHI